MEKETTCATGGTCSVTRRVLEKFWNLGLLQCISTIQEQKLGCLNRTLNFAFFGGNFKRKAGGEFMWIASKFCQPLALIENPVGYLVMQPSKSLWIKVPCFFVWHGTENLFKQHSCVVVICNKSWDLCYCQT